MQSGTHGRVYTYYSTLTDFGAIGLMNTDLEGNELSSYAIARSQTTYNSMSLFSVNNRTLAGWNFRYDPGYVGYLEFYSYDYVTFNNKHYVI